MTDSLHLRRHDAEIGAFAGRVADLLLTCPPRLVDLSTHDERCDRINLHVHHLTDQDDDAATP